jgi:flavin-dependent dehydrogenase
MDGKYDIIVAGSGMSGSLAAAGAAKRGHKVLLLDKNKGEEVGKKTNWGWVCGDAVAESHLDFVTRRIGVKYAKPELDVKVDGVVAYSPDMKTKVNFDGAGYVLDRPEFERKNRDYAVNAGAEYVPEFDVEGPIIENNQVVGIFGKDKGMVHREIRAKVVIDALGVSTNIRRKLPDNPYVDRVVDVDDLESTGRYIYDCEISGEDLRYYDPKVAIIHLNQMVSPGGYGWVFPKGEYGRVNIGIGVQKSSIAIRNQKLSKSDTLHTLMDEYVRSIPNLKNPKLFNKDNNGKGYWSVAVRRNIECLVYNGYLGAGDSMAMPNPISAGGIGPALVAGVLSGEAAARAVESGDTSIKGMWQYNIDFNSEYGKKMAAMEAFRVYLQSLNNDLINYGMAKFLSRKEAEDLAYGRATELSAISKVSMTLSGLSNISAFKNLVYTVGKMKMFNEMYANYPKTPEEFVPWKAKVTQEMREFKDKFKPSPI